MIKSYIDLVKKFFSLKASNKKLLFHLFLSASLRSITILLIPFAASKIVQYATISEFNLTIIWIVLFLIISLTYVCFHHYNYVAYKNNSIFTHNKLQELIMNKVTTYDENFSKEISTPYIVNTAFNDVGDVMQVPDIAFDAIAEVVSIIIALIVLASVNIYIGALALILNIVTLILTVRDLKKEEYYLNGQRKHQDSISGLMGQVLDGNKEITQKCIAKELNISRSYVSRIEKRALTKLLREFIRNNKLTS